MSNSLYHIIMNDSPMAYYRLGEVGRNGTGPARDSSGNLYDGSGSYSTINGGLIPGDPNSGAKLDGATQWIDLPTATNGNGLAAMSVELWFSLSTATLGSFTNIWTSGTSGTHQGFQVYWGSTTSLNFVVGNGTTAGQASAAATATIGALVHIVGIFDGGTVKMYVNNVLGGTTGSLTGPIVASAAPVIGASISHSSPFPGTIDECVLYPYALSTTQIANHYTAGTTASWNTGLTISISDTYITFDEDTLQFHYKADERQRCQFTILDYLGNQSYTRGQQVVVTDNLLGVRFGGVVIDDKQDKSNMYPSVAIEHQMDTIGNEYFPDKRTSNRIYATPQYASTILGDALSDVLAAENVGPYYERLFTTTQNDWALGTLTNTSATLNVGDGDLELAPSGAVVTQSYATQANWNAGTLTNTMANVAGDLSLVGYTRNWNDGNFSNQTLYGTNAPVQGINNGQFALLSGGSGADAKSRFDFAGNTWQNFTVEFDFVAGSSNLELDFVYRTTGWQNLNNTYAYAISISGNNHIGLFACSNSASGGGSFTILQNVAITTLTQGSTHHLKIIVNGNSHIAYLDGVQKINTNNSTYPAAGYVGLRTYNSSGVNQGLFDNFGIMSTFSGTWQSASTSINAVTTIATSVITWDQSLSQGGTILVQTSIDGGSTFQTCANGGIIPGLANGSSGTGKTVIVKITLTATLASAMPDVKSLTWSVLGGYNTSGTWVSPSMGSVLYLNNTPFTSLVGLQNLFGNTVVSWNANLPSAATTLGVDVSIDGGSTWQDVTAQNGGPIPQLNATPAPTVDGFNSNTSANYTSMIGYAGGMATWTYDTAHSRIIATNGASAVYLNNAIIIGSVDLFVDMDLSDAGGMVWCYSDASNFYGLRVCDNQSSVGAKNTITLFKTVGGVQSTLATANITWQRGVYKRIRATTFYPGNTYTTLIISFDGAQVIAYQEFSPLPAGQCGLYAAGGFTTNYAQRSFGSTIDLGTTSGIPTTARFYQFWIQPLGDRGGPQTIMARCRLATTDTTLTPQVLDLTIAAYNTLIGIGTLIPAADYRQKFISTMLDDLAKQSNYIWYIDANKQLNFRQRSAIPAPWILQSSSIATAVDLEADGNLLVDVSNDLYRNRQILTGVVYIGAFVNNFQGDGQTTSFTLLNPVAPGTVPTITLNLVPQKVGKKGTTGSQFYYAENDPVLVQDSTLPVLISTDRLKVSFSGTYIAPLTVDNTAAQTALALLEGGTGIVEAVEDVSKKNMTLAAATVYANQLLTRYCLNGRTVTFATYRDGLQVGQILNVMLPEYNMFNIPVLILSADVTMRTQPNNTIQYFYVVQASELPNAGSWQKLQASSILLT